MDKLTECFSEGYDAQWEAFPSAPEFPYKLGTPEAAAYDSGAYEAYIDAMNKYCVQEQYND